MKADNKGGWRSIVQMSKSIGKLGRLSLKTDSGYFEDAVELAIKLGCICRDGRNSYRRDKVYLRVMKTPAVLLCAGIEHKNMYVAADKINKILEQHKNMTVDMIKALPVALSYPIAVFRRQALSGATGYLVMLDFRDSCGATVRAAVHFDLVEDALFVDNDIVVDTDSMELLRDTREFDKLATSFGAKPRDEAWFERNFDVDDLIYIDADKMKRWSSTSGVDIKFIHISPEEYKRRGVVTKSELDEFWRTHPHLYD